MRSRAPNELVLWFALHLIAILAFTSIGAFAAAAAGVDLSVGWGGILRKELVMASGAWGSWMFLGMGRTTAVRNLARFTVLVPGLAMVGMTLRAFALGYPPDRWVQWLLAGMLAISIAKGTRELGERSFSPVRTSVGIGVSVAAWFVWYRGAVFAGDPTMGLWWNAPIVAVLTSTLLPRLCCSAGRRELDV